MRLGATLYIRNTAEAVGFYQEAFGLMLGYHEKYEDGSFHPFHIYSMRQAIEEGFILDVLKNYTNYSLAYKLAMQTEADNPDSLTF